MCSELLFYELVISLLRRLLLDLSCRLFFLQNSIETSCSLFLSHAAPRRRHDKRERNKKLTQKSLVLTTTIDYCNFVLCMERERGARGVNQVIFLWEKQKKPHKIPNHIFINMHFKLILFIFYNYLFFFKLICIYVCMYVYTQLCV